jgi:hypothetical protein
VHSVVRQMLVSKVKIPKELSILVRCQTQRIV